MPEPANAAAFGPVLSVYTRAQAIEDGILVDVSETAREAGFKIPVAVTRSGSGTDSSPFPTATRGFRTRADVCGTCSGWRITTRSAPPNSDRVRMCVLVRDIRKDLRDSNRPPRKHFPIVAIGSGDRGEAVITIMWPEDD